MATLDDKILGEKLHNYCSSSEDEGRSNDEDNRSGDEEGNSCKASPTNAEPAPANNWAGSASNTGPKGVLEDWKKFKQLEIENRAEMDKECIALAKKFTMPVKTHQQDDREKEYKRLEDEMNELMDEGFLMKFQQRRVQELLLKLHKIPKFGKLITLETKEDFLNAIDKEDVNVIVVIHIYSKNVNACDAMDGCLNVLAGDHPVIKFCRIAADVTGLSRHFRSDGVPALLVYKGGDIIGNFVQLTNELGHDFYATDVEKFLVEYGILREKIEES